ncbi:Hypothetical predicted protein [Octopus vulgaris]|uniref:Uncharacterized protein n=1 Tax=Octopus vulgaris TaxID=6645 RepID=A0AA36BGN0_OCTVU|nr:Hypothetical predicted protein [Octopus vulgaris]
MRIHSVSGVTLMATGTILEVVLTTMRRKKSKEGEGGGGKDEEKEECGIGGEGGEKESRGGRGEKERRKSFLDLLLPILSRVFSNIFTDESPYEIARYERKFSKSVSDEN